MPLYRGIILLFTTRPVPPTETTKPTEEDVEATALLGDYISLSRFGRISLESVPLVCSCCPSRASIQQGQYGCPLGRSILSDSGGRRRGYEEGHGEPERWCREEFQFGGPTSAIAAARLS